MPTRRCCCRGCLIAKDSFDRDGSSLGSGWTHPVDQWHTVASGTPEFGYAESQIDGARALHNTAHPLPSTSGHVVITITNDAVDSGNIYRVIVNAVDLDNYHYAEFVRNGQYDSIIRLGIRSGGSDTILKSQTITELLYDSWFLSVKIADNEFCAEMGTQEVTMIYLEDETPIPLGYYAGMGADAGTRIADWQFLQHAQTNRDCASCACKCLGDYVGTSLSAVIEGEVWAYVGGADDGGIVYVYDYEGSATLHWSPTAGWWDGFGHGESGTQDIGWYLQLRCPGNTPDDVELEGIYLCNPPSIPFSSGGVNLTPPVPVEAGWSCDPLIMVFKFRILICEPETAGWIDLVITITEAP